MVMNGNDDVDDDDDNLLPNVPLSGCLSNSNQIDFTGLLKCLGR